MKKIYYILFLLSPAFFSCEKVIDVDLNDASPAIVIEGNLSYLNGELEVTVSETGSYFGNDAVAQINNASVILEHHTGIEFKIPNKGDGLYKREGILLRPNNIYGLKVEVDGKAYSAESKLNPEVPIDSLGYEYFRGVAFFEGGYRVKLFFSDPPEKENYYRIKVYQNGDLQNRVDNLIVFDDSNINGKVIEVTLRGQDFSAMDTARVELLSIDHKAWNYLSSLRDLANTNPGSPAPANPISNFDNGALGYFSAWSHDSKTIIIEAKQNPK